MDAISSPLVLIDTVPIAVGIPLARIANGKGSMKEFPRWFSLSVLVYGFFLITEHVGSFPPYFVYPIAFKM